MLFNSYIFVLLFLPLCIVGYFTLNHFKKYHLAQTFLLGMSLWFYGYNNPRYLLVIAASIFINFSCYKLLEQCRVNVASKSLTENSSDEIELPNKKRAKVIMLAGVVINVGILIYFKYMDFFIENFNSIFKTDLAFLRIALPLGISFFTFQQISFIVDAYHREIPGYGFVQYACFVSYFPQLIAGPIVTHDELVPQFMDEERKKFNADNVLQGIYIFALGLAKKVLLADTFGKAADYGYAFSGGPGSLTAIITIVAYTIQIYFDFSGYCDIAIGLGKMMNIDLPLNFNSPYKALTITEFWDRWHMTLTRFFTKYIYIPLGGSQKGTVKTCINIFIVFLISGFWHGANWTFVVWGAMHGVFNIITRTFKNFFKRIPKVLNWMITFTFVNVAWVFFRSENFSVAFNILKKAIAFDFSAFDMGFATEMTSAEIAEILDILKIQDRFPAFVLVAYFAVAFSLILGSKNAYEKMQNFKPTLFSMGTALFLLVWSIFSFAGISTFLYFNF